MLVNCQECDARISDSAERCPKCGAPPDVFLGPSLVCAECGADYQQAFDVCANCGAPRWAALDELHPDVEKAIDAAFATDGPADIDKVLFEPSQPLEAAPLPVGQESFARSSPLDDEPTPHTDDGTGTTSVDDIWSRPAPTDPALAARQSNGTGHIRHKNMAARILGGIFAVAAAASAGVAFLAPKVLGAAGGYVAAKAVTGAVVGSSSSPEAQVDMAMSKLESDPNFGPFYAELRSSFPSDYQRLRRLMIDHYDDSSDPAYLSNLAYDWGQKFYLDHASEIAEAPDAVLAALADESLIFAEMLKEESDAACAGFTLGDGVGSSFKASPAGVKQLAAMNVAQLKAITMSRTQPTIRREPTEDDFEKLYSAVVAGGLSERLETALYDGEIARLKPSEQCELGVAILRVTATLPPESSAFWTSYNAVPEIDQAAGSTP